jgi:type IV pilus assembly protein PilV
MHLNRPIASRHRGTGRTPPRHGQRGISLLESLVALVVLAIAVLGMLAIQLRTLAETQTGVHRAQAVRVIEDLAERIKSNPEGFARLADYTAGWDAAAPDTPADCTANACTPAQLAQWDLGQWRQSVAQKLPKGQANTFLSSDETAGVERQLGVMLGWRVNERSNDDGDYVAPFILATQELPDGVACPDGLICHLVYVQP